MRRLRLFSLILLFISLRASSQIRNNTPVTDTVKLALVDAEKLFLEKNSILLAQKYQIEATKALIIQARLWNNPNLSGTLLILNNKQVTAADGSTKTLHKYFDFSSAGEQAYQIGQLISIAGKKRNAVRVAKLNTLMAEDQYYDLIRTLKSQLRTDFYTIFFNQQSLGIYAQEIEALTKTSIAYQTLLQKGFIAKKEALRIQAQLFALENEQIALSTQIIQSQADLNILLDTRGTYFLPQVDTAGLNRISIASFSLLALSDSALANRYDLKVSTANLESSRYSLRLQKSLAYPDPTISYSFDRNGSYVPSSRFLSLGFDIPVFNRNQGNIKNAVFNIKNNEAQLANQQRIVESDVYKAYNAALLNERMAKGFDPVFAQNYKTLVQEVLKNYQKRNIGLLEFLDYYDSFKQNVLQTNTLKLNRMAAYELINFAVGKDIIK